MNRGPVTQCSNCSCELKLTVDGTFSKFCVDCVTATPLNVPTQEMSCPSCEAVLYRNPLGNLGKFCSACGHNLSPANCGSQGLGGASDIHKDTGVKTELPGFITELPAVKLEPGDTLTVGEHYPTGKGSQEETLDTSPTKAGKRPSSDTERDKGHFSTGKFEQESPKVAETKDHCTTDVRQEIGGSQNWCRLRVCCENSE